MATARKGNKLPELRGRKWTDNELKQFAIVLAGDKYEFALRLETLARKKFTNIHVFELGETELDARLNVEKCKD